MKRSEMSRQDINRKILSLLTKAVDANSDQRFCQILVNLKISTKVYDFNTSHFLNEISFYEESYETLDRIESDSNAYTGNK